MSQNKLSYAAALIRTPSEPDCDGLNDLNLSSSSASELSTTPPLSEDSTSSTGPKPAESKARAVLRGMQEQGLILFFFDVERHCYAPRKITEVGIAILDLQEVAEVEPGDRGVNWHKYVKPSHFRVIDNHHDLRCNSDWHNGHHNRFLFGKSEWVQNEAQLKLRINQIIKDATRAPNASAATASATPALDDGRNKAAKVTRSFVPGVFDKGMEMDASVFERWDLIMPDPGMLDNSIKDKWSKHNPRRRHDFTDYMDVQSHPAFGGRLRPHVRTATGQRKSKISLETDMVEFCGIASKELHNGGNDAVFELQCFLAMAFMTEKQWGCMPDAVKPMLAQSWPEKSFDNSRLPPH